MRYAKIKDLPPAQFRRFTGVKKTTFDRMVEIIGAAHKEKKSRGGRPNKLSIEEMVMMTLEYLRQYRTYLQIGTTYGLSESNAFECIRWVESVLVQHEDFRLLGKKALLDSDMESEVILVDATESPVERPKKNNINSTQGKRSGTR